MSMGSEKESRPTQAVRVDDSAAAVQPLTYASQITELHSTGRLPIALQILSGLSLAVGLLGALFVVLLFASFLRFVDDGQSPRKLTRLVIVVSFFLTMAIAGGGVFGRRNAVRCSLICGLLAYDLVLEAAALLSCLYSKIFQNDVHQADAAATAAIVIFTFSLLSVLTGGMMLQRSVSRLYLSDADRAKSRTTYVIGSAVALAVAATLTLALWRS